MMTYYYCNEDDRILSTAELHQEFDMLRSEGEYPGVSFSDYLTGCQWFNNGALTPLLNHIDNLKRDLARVKSYNNPDDDEWIATLSAQVTECERYFMEV
jgi:hypothetical protein